MRKNIAGALLLAAMALPCIAQEQLSPIAPKVTAVIKGLDNPRGLAFGPEGALYVVEAGRGGNGPCTIRLGQAFCYGPTAAVRRLWKGKLEFVATGLPSIARPNGNRAQGADGISFQGRGGLYVSIGWESNPHERSDLGDAGSQFAQLIRITPDGQWDSGRDLGNFEIATHPVNPDSDPFNVLAEPGGQLVIESGANRLLRVRTNGDISIVAGFPSREDGRSTDSVPTSVIAGPDGAYYVSELTGLPFAAGAANIYRVEEGEQPTVFLSGFKTVIDIAFNSEGNLYVLEHSSGALGIGNPGKLKRVELHGCTVVPNLCPRTEILSGIDRPTAIAIGPDDEVYMSVHGISAGIGEVWRIDP
jgi:hypothetical protein